MKKSIFLNNKHLLVLLLFCTSIGMNAQQKIGTNPAIISSNTNFEVEATNGSKLKVSSDTGKVTIADGTQADGKVLTSDSNGVATWKKSSVSLVNGVIPSALTVPIANSSQTTGYTGCYIQLTAGTWVLKFSSWLSPIGNVANPRRGFVSMFFSTSSTLNIPPIYYSGVKSILGTPFYQSGSNVADFYINGEIPITLTSDTTLYLWFFVSNDVYSSYPSSMVSQNNFAGAYGPYTQLYATPVSN